MMYVRDWIVFYVLCYCLVVNRTYSRRHAGICGYHMTLFFFFIVNIKYNCYGFVLITRSGILLGYSLKTDKNGNATKLRCRPRAKRGPYQFVGEPN